MIDDVSIEYPNNRGDYALKYDTERYPQEGGIELDPVTKTLRTYVNTEIGASGSLSAQYGLILHYPGLDYELTVDEVKDILNRVKPYAVRVCKGYERVQRDGQCYGELSDDAQDASQRIGDIVQGTVSDKALARARKTVYGD